MKILVIVDMQNDFIDMALGTKEACEIVPGVVHKINEFHGDKIYYTMDTHTPNYLNTQEGKYLPVEHCILGSKGWELNESVKEALAQKSCDVVEVRKPTFGSVDLMSMVTEDANGRDLSIEMVGLCTDICVVSNALILKAALPEVSIKIDRRCIAGVTPQSNDAAIETMKMCQILIV